MAPNVSVALCTRNGERFIAEQLRSILSQSVPTVQLVVSDDDSRDATAGIVMQMLADTPVAPELVRLENRPPLGVTKNFESAIGETTGELVFLSDQDDSWHPDKVERISALFDEDPRALLVFTDARLVDEEGVPLGASLFENLEVRERELGPIAAGNGLEVLLRRNVVTGATVAFRRELLEAALPFPESWVHDEWLAIVAAIRGGLRVLPEQTIDYRQHSSNEIGVAEPTLRRKIGRMLQSRGQRNQELARKFSDLASWAEARAVAPQIRAALRQKAAFERRRAQMPATRVLRIPTVVALAVRGSYAHFASQGPLDIARDLLQPA